MWLNQYVFTEISLILKVQKQVSFITSTWLCHHVLILDFDVLIVYAQHIFIKYNNLARAGYKLFMHPVIPLHGCQQFPLLTINNTAHVTGARMFEL